MSVPCLCDIDPRHTPSSLHMYHSRRPYILITGNKEYCDINMCINAVYIHMSLYLSSSYIEQMYSLSSSSIMLNYYISTPFHQLVRITGCKFSYYRSVCVQLYCDKTNNTNRPIYGQLHRNANCTALIIGAAGNVLFCDKHNHTASACHWYFMSIITNTLKIVLYILLIRWESERIVIA